MVIHKSNYCTSVYEHHYKIFYIKIAIFLLFQLFDMVFKTMDRQCESFSRIISSGLDKSLYLFGTLGLHRLLTKTLKFLKNLKIKKISKNFKISKISKKFKIFIAFQNLHKISKFSKNFKILN